METKRMYGRSYKQGEHVFYHSADGEKLPCEVVYDQTRQQFVQIRFTRGVGVEVPTARVTRT